MATHTNDHDETSGDGSNINHLSRADVAGLSAHGDGSAAHFSVRLEEDLDQKIEVFTDRQNGRVHLAAEGEDATRRLSVGVELTPEQARALSDVLVRGAADVESHRGEQ